MSCACASWACLSNASWPWAPSRVVVPSCATRTSWRDWPAAAGAFERVLEQERNELSRRERAYRGANAAPLRVRGRDVIVVDDGLATGATMEAAVRSLRALEARRIVVAVPVASPEAVARVGTVADDVVCAIAPVDFGAVGECYRVFDQTSDAEVARLLTLYAAGRKEKGATRS